MAVAIQQLNVRVQQQETAMTILAQERERLAQQVQSMPNTPRQRVQAGVVDTRVIGKPDQFDGDPMKHADRSFKLRSYLGAVDQRYQEELTKTEASSTPRLNANLESEERAPSTHMYYILVMTTAGAALDKCHNAGVNEWFEAWRQFVMEWEPKLRTRYVRLLMNKLGYRFRDDIPTKLAAFERTVHDYENQSTKTVDDDIKIGVTMLGMEDMRVEEHLIQKSVKYIDSQPMPVQLGANPKSKGKGKESKGKRQGHQRQRQGQGCEERIVEKRKERRSEKCFNCNKTSHVRANCRKRLKDLAEAEGKSVAASPHPHDTAAVVPSQCELPGERHSSTFVTAMPCVNSETSCEFSSEQAVRSPGAGSFAPAETQRARPVAAIPSNETYLIWTRVQVQAFFQEVLIRVLQKTRRWHH